MSGRSRSKIDRGIQAATILVVLAFPICLRQLQLNDLSNVTFFPFLLSLSNIYLAKLLPSFLEKGTFLVHMGNKIR